MARQQPLNIYKGKRGGRRPGCGRKRKNSKGVAHRVRSKVTARTPLHINFKYKTAIKNKFCLRLLKRAILNARGKGLKVLHFSLQSNHVHLIVEAQDNSLLSTRMRSLLVTFAMGLKQGRVQLERYHLHVLKTVNEIKNAVRYVLFNQQKHERGLSSTIDEYSSILKLKNAMEVIKEFAKKEGIWLKIGLTNDLNLDRGGHLYQMAAENLV